MKMASKKLVGQIEHFMHSTELQKAGTKRPRPDPSPPSSQSTGASYGPYGSMNSLPKIGFYFIPDITSSDDQGQSQLQLEQDHYQLVVPQGHAMQAVIDSARFLLKVTLTAYRIICTDRINESGVKIKIIELHEQGINLQRQHMDETKDEKEVYTLRQFRDLEPELNMIRKDKNNRKSVLHNIRCMVDSVSPIIGMPNDPFALVELFHDSSDGVGDENDCNLTAVLVLKGGTALISHPGIRPGDTLTLINVKRQRWHVPRSFQEDESIPKRLHHRAPSHVFVVSDPKNIQWCNQKINTNEQQELNGNGMRNNPCPPLPSTLFPLTSIQGRITHVQYSHTQSSGGRTIQYIFLEYKSQKVKLHLSYFPLSSSNCMGLREGAWVQAMNVHRIDSPVLTSMRQTTGKEYSCFGACLRSTVNLTETASEWHGSEKSELSLVVEITSMVTPHTFKSVKQAYHEMEWMSLSRRQFSHCTVSAKIVDRTLRKIASAKINDACSFSSRDPYREFFDHGCEDTMGSEGSLQQMGSCPCEINNPQMASFPFTMSLTEIKNHCLAKMLDVLIKYSQEREKRPNMIYMADRADVGWTASIQLERRDFHRSEHYIGNLVTGGILGNADNSKGGLMFIEDGKSRLTFVPHYKRGGDFSSEYSRHSKGDFVLTWVQNAVVSSIYLGRCRLRDDDERYSAVQNIHLPLFAVGDKSLSVEGPSYIMRVRGNVFAISVQVQYDIEKSINLNSNAVSNNSSWNSAVSLSMAMSINPTSTISEKETPVLCKLLRQRWKIQKSSEAYSGCQLTLAHIEQDPLSDTNVHHSAQTLEIKLKIPLEKISLTDHFFQVRSITDSLPRNVLHLGLAWQYFAESSLAPIAMGGWDEYVRDFQTNESSATEVYVSFPRGIVNLNGSKVVEMNDLSSMLVTTPSTPQKLMHFVPHHDNSRDIIRILFAYLGGRKMFFPGMLDLRLRRSVIFNSSRCMKFGEANVPPELITGAKSISLATLWSEAILVGSSAQMHKGTVVKIKNAQIASLRFCRARVECTRCFSPFISRHSSTNQKDNKRKTQFCIDNKPSFWDNPLPLKYLQSHTSRGIDCNIKKTPPKVHERKIMCPSGCDDRYGSIKWELSCVIHDNTGTSKLYADRDVVVLLLGRGLNLDIISDGAWDTPVGISYQNGLPLDSNLRCELDAIKKEIVRNKGAKKAPPESFLSCESRARYELYKHCRRSKELHRKMDFLCQVKTHSSRKTRIKPHELSLVSTIGNKGVIHFNDMSISVQQLELTLIDCFKSCKTTASNAWALIESLNLT